MRESNTLCEDVGISWPAWHSKIVVTVGPIWVEAPLCKRLVMYDPLKFHDGKASMGEDQDHGLLCQVPEGTGFLKSAKVPSDPLGPGFGREVDEQYNSPLLQRHTLNCPKMLLSGMKSMCSSHSNGSDQCSPG